MIQKFVFSISIVLFSFISVRDGMGQWTPVTGPDGGPIHCLVADGTLLFAGTDQGIFLSKNEGGNWKSVSTGLTMNGMKVYSLLCVGTNLFAGTEDGVFRSSDSGTTWVLANSGISFPVQTAPQPLAAIGTILYAGIQSGGFFRSTDQGLHWSEFQLYWTNPIVTAFENIGSILIAGTGTGTFRSTDSGATWVQTSQSYAVAFDRIGSQLFVGCDGEGVFVSSDTGLTWNRSSNGLLNADSSAEVTGLTVVGSDLIANMLAIGTAPGGGIYRSSDTGKSWMSVDSTDTLYSCFAVIGTTLFDGSVNGVFRSSNDGATWAFSNSGLAGASFQVISSGDNLVALSNNSIFYSTDDGTSWQGPTLQGLQLLLSISGNTIMASNWVLASGDQMYLSSDHGETWEEMTGLHIKGSQPKAMAAIGNNLCVGTSDEIFHSTNNGKDWSESPSSLQGTYIDNFVWCNPKLLTSTGYGVFESDDSGNGWRKIDDGSGSSEVAIGDEIILVGDASGGSLQRSEDGGASWEDVGSGCNMGSMFLLQNTIIGTSECGVYLSKDSGKGWKYIGVLDSIPTAPIIDWFTGLAICGNGLYVNMVKGSVWRHAISDFGISSAVKTPAATPYAIRIYPNPLSQSTTISFAPETSGYAGVSIVNPLGVEIAHLFSGELGIGNHSVIWNPVGVAAGMYECVVRMNGLVETLPIVLQR